MENNFAVKIDSLKDPIRKSRFKVDIENNDTLSLLVQKATPCISSVNRPSLELDILETEDMPCLLFELKSTLESNPVVITVSYFDVECGVELMKIKFDHCCIVEAKHTLDYFSTNKEDATISDKGVIHHILFEASSVKMI